MTVAVVLLALDDYHRGGRGLLIAVNPRTVERQPAEDPLFQLDMPLDRQRWTGIVVHDLGEPAGDAESIHRRHLALGYHGLGYHFVIGNGNGLGDGAVEVGYRWHQQKPGAHVGGRNGAYFNEHTIGICMVGNGDRRSITERQLTSLVSLVRRLQRELDIPSSAVYLHRDLAAGVSSPGRFFPEAELRERLREVRR